MELAAARSVHSAGLVKVSAPLWADRMASVSATRTDVIMETILAQALLSGIDQYAYGSVRRPKKSAASTTEGSSTVSARTETSRSRAAARSNTVTFIQRAS